VPRKRGPIGAATDDDLVDHIRRVLAESPFHGEGYRKVWARLRHRGIRTAAERVRRLMREHHLQAPRRGGNAHGPKAHDGTITTDEPDTMWGTVRRFIVR
jgi:transposase InsO family protein